MQCSIFEISIYTFKAKSELMIKSSKIFSMIGFPINTVRDSYETLTPIVASMLSSLVNASWEKKNI